MRATAVVIGGGHNGLVCATDLARAGREVVLLDQLTQPGGLSAPLEFHPGFTAPGLLHDQGRFPVALAHRLGLKAHGLRYRERAPRIRVASPGSAFWLDPEPGATERELGEISPPDREAWAKWRKFVDAVCPVLARMLESAPPPLTPRNGADLLALGRSGFGVRRLGRDTMYELLRVVPMCAADWLQEFFSLDALSEAISLPAVQHTSVGPWSPGSAANLLLHECSVDRWIEGGPLALIEALTSACAANGVGLRTQTRVTRIEVDNGRVAGVHCDDGSWIEADAVVAACDPATALLGLVEPAVLPASFEDEVGAIRNRGTTAAVLLALAGAPEFEGLESPPEWLRLGGGDLDALERAADAAKYDRFSDRPALEIRIPTVARPDLAPAGNHVLSIHAHWAPYELDGGWTDSRQERLLEAVIGRLSDLAPRIRAQILGALVLPPPAIEQRYGLSGGHLFHVEHALDQLGPMRPSWSTAGYRTPIAGLYLGSAGSHPGGGLTGMPGALAARAVLGGRV